MTLLSLMRLAPKPEGCIAGGSVMLDSQELLTLPEAAMRNLRGAKKVAMIFQESMTSLNPVLHV